MVRKLVSKSVPIVHHVTIPCSESLLVSSFEGTVAAKVPHFVALGTLLLFLGLVLDLPTGFDALGILFPVCVSALFETRDYLPYGCLLPGPHGTWSLISIAILSYASMLFKASFHSTILMHWNALWELRHAIS